MDQGKKSIYIADDEMNIREAIRAFLESEGYDVKTFETGDALYEVFTETPCNLVILDVMMPGSDGFEICKKLRQISTVPIIMLTAKDSDLDYATGLSLGSDDYFTKPFSAMALVMRVKAIFRRIEFEKNRNESLDGETLTFGNLSINPKSKEVFLKDNPLFLTPNERDLLSYLIEKEGEAISREELLDKVWGYENIVETRAVDDTIHRLRKKIKESNVNIETVWGFGFRLKEEV